MTVGGDRKTTIWHELWGYLVEDDGDEGDADFDAAAVTALLRVMVLRGGPPTTLRPQLSPEHAGVVKEGARLRAGLPPYLARRQAILAEHCALIAPLIDFVHGYQMPTTTEELWATGLGAVMQGAARPRTDNGADAAPLRRVRHHH
jgi:hypothetical protein